MQAKNFIPTLALVSAILTGCSSNEPNAPNEQRDQQEDNRLEIAMEIAEKMIADLDGPATRGIKRSVRKIESISIKNNTRSDDADEGIYIVSYKDDMGFVMVNTADPEFPVYAFSNEGSLSINDTTTNPEFKEYVYSLIPNYPENGDSVKWINPNPGGLKPLEPIKPSYGEVKVSPILTRTVAEWGQGYPFNKLCPTIQASSGGTTTALTGCVPLACAMVMSHYKWPTSYNGTNFNWEDIRTNYYSNDVPKLIVHLQESRNLDCTFKSGATSTKGSNIARTFYNFGYQKPTLEDGISTNGVTNGNPILITGLLTTDSHTGHAWVLDGLYVYHHSADYLEIGRPSYDEYFYHTVWGWNSSSNGYFKYTTTNAGSSRYNESYEPKVESTTQFTNFKSIGALKKR